MSKSTENPIFVTLTPNRQLLNPFFENYKLKTRSQSDIVKHFPLPGPVGIDVKVENKSSTPYEILKARGKFNHLFGDPSGKRSVYYIDERYHVIQLEFDLVGFTIFSLSLIF